MPVQRAAGSSSQQARHAEKRASGHPGLDRGQSDRSARSIGGPPGDRE
jgi:hypothetical protein